MPDFITVITFLSETTVGTWCAEAEIRACARQVPSTVRGTVLVLRMLLCRLREFESDRTPRAENLFTNRNKYSADANVKMYLIHAHIFQYTQWYI